MPGNAQPKRLTVWGPTINWVATWTGVGLALAVVLVALRSPWSPDETRVLAVAWEMWHRDLWLIPLLNGETYPQQAPLLPWLTLFGWHWLGVNDWWPRVILALFSLFSLLLTSRLAKYLWIDQLEMPGYVPVVLLGTFSWILFLTLALPTMLLVFFTLLAQWAVLRAWRFESRRSAWFLYGLALGLGILSSGAVSLLYILPTAVLAPVWAGKEHAIRWVRWYADLATAVSIGLGMVLFWGLVVAGDFGDDYAYDLLFHVLPQDLGMFSQDRPLWWVLALLPLVFLPWSAWPLVWSRLWQLKGKRFSSGVIFCLVWAVPVIVVLTVLGPRQSQFLLPVVPVFALFVSYLLLNEELVDHGEKRFFVSLTFPLILLGVVLAVIPLLPPLAFLPASLWELSPLIGIGIVVIVAVITWFPLSGLWGRVLLIVVGGILAVLPALPRIALLPAFLWDLSPFVGIGIGAAGVALIWLPSFELKGRIIKIAVTSMVLAVLGLLIVDFELNSGGQAQETGAWLAAAEHRPLAVAYVGTYNGQFHFAGRLKNSLEVLSKEEVADWIKAHPQGVLLTYADQWQPVVRPASQPVFVSHYRGTILRIWQARSIITP